MGGNDAGQRAERYLRKYFPHLSLDRLHSLFRRKEIKVSKRPIQRSHLLASGDTLQVYGLKEAEAAGSGPGDGGGGPSESGSHPGAAGERALPFDIPVLFEDADLLVLNKPPHMAVHPGTGIRSGESLIERVWVRAGSAPMENELFRPSLVHRLDKETSGVILVAKSGPCLRRLTAVLRAGGMVKKYLALVEGAPHPPEGLITGALQRVDSRTGGAKAEVTDGEGKWAVTRYRTLKDLGKFSLLSVIIETGRMHQIRAHLAHAGHPLVGDSRYGSREGNREIRKTLGLKRTFLHASDLEVDMGLGKKAVFHSPLPRDLASVLGRLGDSPASAP